MSCLDRKFIFRFNIHHAIFLKNILEIDWKFLIADIWPQTRSKETPKRTSSSITPTFNLRVRDNQDTSFGME